MTRVSLTKITATTSRRYWVKIPDVFCYTCGKYIVKESRTPLFNIKEKAYLAYFGVHLGDQNESWAPHVMCETYLENLFLSCGFKGNNRQT